jgi:hypothetical protein
VNSTASQPQSARWLAENGPKELESLFRAIIFHPSAPILIADNDRRYREASTGCSLSHLDSSQSLSAGASRNGQSGYALTETSSLLFGTLL